MQLVLQKAKVHFNLSQEGQATWFGRCCRQYQESRYQTLESAISIGGDDDARGKAKLFPTNTVGPLLPAHCVP